MIKREIPHDTDTFFTFHCFGLICYHARIGDQRDKSKKLEKSSYHHCSFFGDHPVHVLWADQIYNFYVNM